MAETHVRCALPGCDQLVESGSDGGPQRKYCCREHSVEARRLRQRARADAAPGNAGSAVAASDESVPATAVLASGTSTETVEAAVSAPAGSSPVRQSKRGWWAARGGAAAVILAALAVVVGPASAGKQNVPAAAPAPVADPSSAAPSIVPADSPIVVAANPAEGPPAVPAGLVVTAGNGQARLCWTPVAGATAYVMYYRDATTAQPWQRMPYPITDRCWLAGQLSNSHTYEFRIIASNSSGDSGFSAVVAATPAQPKPRVPDGLGASPGDGQVRLCWKAAANADMYVIYLRDVAANASWTRIQYPVTNGVCWTGHLLTDGHLYQFRVTSANSNGESAYSDPVSATPTAPAPVLPAVPAGLTATPGSGRVLLCWRPAANANAYVAYYRDLTIGQDWVTMPYPIQNATCWNADQLWNTHTYQFRLTASNNAGHSGFSGIVAATPG